MANNADGYFPRGGMFLWFFHPLGLSQPSVLAFLALLAGFIYAFTNANDQRVLSKRRVLSGGKYVLSSEKTSGFLEPKEFVALAGALGASLTWVLLLPLYYTFSLASDRPLGNFLNDLFKAAATSFLVFLRFFFLESSALLVQ